MAAPETNPEKTEAKKANKTTESIAAPAPVQKSGSGFALTLAIVAILVSGGGIYKGMEAINLEKQNTATALADLQRKIDSELQNNQAAIRNELSQTESAIKNELSTGQRALLTELATKSQAIETLAKQVESNTAAKIGAAETTLAKAKSDLSTALVELGKANQSIRETKKRQESLETNLAAVYKRIGNTSREWAIAEADYLLKIANHRLQLEHDVTTSIQALTLADKRINSLADPALAEVRNVIAQELVALQTLPIPDQAGVSMQLAQLENQVDRLPLAARTQPVNQKNTKEFKADDAMKVESWEALPVAVLDVLKGMVAVNYNDKPLEALLSPEQVKNLHENLKLKLEQARMVLLRGDEKLFTSNIDLAIDWTNKFFNVDEVATKKFLDTLNYLKTKQVVLKVPDISTSLRTLRSVAKRLEMNLPDINSNASTVVDDKAANLVMN
ncbi:MAG TPA: hypothetical protein ENK06_08150 [Gammaproteobacteria bacterium]|nr:hypothetical protein [Gammaproteobacteria bacterium]